MRPYENSEAHALMTAFDQVAVIWRYQLNLSIENLYALRGEGVSDDQVIAAIRSYVRRGQVPDSADDIRAFLAPHPDATEGAPA